MSYGLEVHNTAGTKMIISESYPGYHYLGDATLVGTRQWRLTVGYQDYYLLPFVVSGSNTYSTVEALVQRADIAPGTWDIYVRNSSGNDANVLRVLCFSVLPPSIGSAPAYSASGLNNYGLQVFLGNGGIAFDSTRRPLYIRAIQDMSGFDVTASAAAFSLTIPTLETPAVFSACTGALRYTEYGNTQDVYWEKLLGSRVIGTSLQHQLIPAYSLVTNHSYVAELLAPSIQEDIVLNSVVAVIDAAKYIYN
jgi:hypothetical protein